MTIKEKKEFLEAIVQKCFDNQKKTPQIKYTQEGPTIFVDSGNSFYYEIFIKEFDENTNIIVTRFPVLHIKKSQSAEAFKYATNINNMPCIKFAYYRESESVCGYSETVIDPNMTSEDTIKEFFINFALIIDIIYDILNEFNLDEYFELQY